MDEYLKKEKLNRRFFYISSILTASLVLSGVFDFSYAQAPQTKVIYLKGQVKVQHAGEEFWILAKKGMVLNDKDKIKTFVGSEVEIALDTTLKNIIRLEPDTETTMEDLKKKNLFMQKGKVLAVIEALPAGSSFEVRTPTAVCGVAGTGISIDTDGKKTSVRCLENKAYVRGLGADGKPMAGLFIISEGYKRAIERLETPGELIIITTYEREEWVKFRENLREHLDELREKRAEGSRAAALEMLEIERMRRRR